MPGGYRFSFARRMGDVMLVVIDAATVACSSRATASMVDDDEWAWIVEQCQQPTRGTW